MHLAPFLQPGPVPGISAVPHEDNLRYFDVEIHGPAQSPYEGWRHLQARALPPRRLSHDAAQDPLPDKDLPPQRGQAGPHLPRRPEEYNWSPALQIRTILLSIQALLGAPNPDDPLAADVAKSWKEDEQAAIATAKEWTKQYAQP
ncbi:ubiquitin-conjugating enzyme, active site protein [Purpureocillium lilacinum]|uniref:Ubiquitin-conjugating enzyme, active site protein n=1 Tax=Purpureocillium lilacinum TaxID=33203 RepID=A0A179H7I0_PURLI|nr:ubiquitin-conjugating enzyme, active site protein [Purpureocillium lilacinum]